jgi:TM2 domain-containing membrane protein YozV
MPPPPAPVVAAIPGMAVAANGKSRALAALFAFFLGGIGGHKFYLGQTGMGVLYLLFFWTGIPALAGIVEMILYLVMSDEEFAYKYGWR